jgi:hypothetical protein
LNHEVLAAVLEHLRHERESVEPPAIVERPEDFLLASDLHPVACVSCHINIPSGLGWPPLNGGFPILGW